METTTNQSELTTRTTADGKQILNPEPVNCFGADDWEHLTFLRDGMQNNLYSAIAAELEHNHSGDDLTRAHCEMMAVLNAVEDINKYRERYLRRRIHQLERALNLQEFGDIDDILSNPNE